MKQKKTQFTKDEHSSKKSMDDLFAVDNWQDSSTTFPKEVFDLLPDLFRSISNEFETDSEKSTVLFCLIILCSGVLPFYYTTYDKRRCEANLYGYLIGSFGSGKGVLNICRAMIEPIHKEKVERSTLYRQWYEDNKDSGIPDMRLPIDEMLILPGNITKAKFYMVLKENKGLIIVETETDTLTSANRSEHGDFSALLRAAYEHEPLSVARKGDGIFYIPEPFLTVMLSSTPNQLFKLIPEIENGLYSRFAFFKIVSGREFKNVFDNSGISPYEAMGLRSEFLKWLHEELIASHNDVEFVFTSAQQLEFCDFFTQMKEESFEIYGSEMDGEVHRLGLIFTRIAMILSIVRIFDLSLAPIDLPLVVECTKRDFECTKLIVNALSENSRAVYEMLMKGKSDRESNSETASLEEKLQQRKMLDDLFYQGLSDREISKEIFGTPTKGGTICKWRKKAGLVKPPKK